MFKLLRKIFGRNENPEYDYIETQNLLIGITDEELEQEFGGDRSA